MDYKFITMNSQEIKNILQTTYPFLNENDLSLLLELGNYQELKNRSVVIQEGKIQNQLFFILKGMVRGYYINDDGVEINVFLRPEHTITGAPDSLFNNVSTKYNFQTVVHSHLLFFPFLKMLELSEVHPNIAKVYIACLQENVQTLIFRVESLIDKLPEERFDELLEKRPQFFDTALNKHIANYLGITPNSYSRILKRKKSS